MRIIAIEEHMLHMDEGLPFHLDRIEEMLSPVVTGQSLTVAETLRSNIYHATSGYNFDALRRI